MKTPAEFAIKHPVILTMFLIVLMFFGAFSLQNQNIEFMAPINLPSVIVYTIYPGASAKDVERSLLGLPGVLYVHIHAHDGETTIDYNPAKTKLMDILGVFGKYDVEASL